MTDTGARFMDFDDHDLQGRLTAFLGRQYVTEHRSKRLAADIGCDPRAAKNIFLGHWPGARAWRGLVRRFGRDLLEAVFAPEIDTTLARLQAEERKLEEALERARALRRQAEGGGVVGARRVAQAADGTDTQGLTPRRADRGRA